MKKFTKNILQIITGICTMVTLCAGKAMALTVQEGAEAARADGMPENLVGVDGVFTRITNTVLYVVGAISVLMLIWGGLRYIISGGDSKKITDAKNTILYALLGLIIAFFAYAIVNFVLNAISPTPEQNAENAALILNHLV
jgi:succinate dehydrogenase hydrophobic anchor subunit